MSGQDHMRTHLGNLSRSLLRLHKALLDSERVSYELSEEEEIGDRTEMTLAIDSVRTMLTPSEEGNGFGRHYYDALQREPDVVLAHAAVRALLRTSSPGKESIT